MGSWCPLDSQVGCCAAALVFITNDESFSYCSSSLGSNCFRSFFLFGCSFIYLLVIIIVEFDLNIIIREEHYSLLPVGFRLMLSSSLEFKRWRNMKSSSNLHNLKNDSFLGPISSFLQVLEGGESVNFRCFPVILLNVLLNSVLAFETSFTSISLLSNF